jgi:hypothetical protein
LFKHKPISDLYSRMLHQVLRTFLQIGIDLLQPAESELGTNHPSFLPPLVTKHCFSPLEIIFAVHPTDIAS